MAEKLFTVYCPREGIEGMLEEKKICNRMLELARRGERAVALIYINQNHDWLYGQCNFKNSPADMANYKFSDKYESVMSQAVLPDLIKRLGARAMFVTDTHLLERLSANVQTSKYKDRFELLEMRDGHFLRPPAKPAKTFLERILGKA